MSGVSDLQTLLGSMSPALSAESYVFISSRDRRFGLAELEPWALISEEEGLTLILDKARADERGLAYESAFRRITLTVHSSLEAVGLTAAVSTALASRGISANVVDRMNAGGSEPSRMPCSPSISP